MPDETQPPAPQLKPFDLPQERLMNLFRRTATALGESSLLAAVITRSAQVESIVDDIYANICRPFRVPAISAQ